MRTYFKVLLPIFCTVLCYSLLSILFGAKGIYAQRGLESQRDIMISHVKDLHEISDELDARIANLSYDYDTIKVYANALGYINNGEEIIKLSNFNGGIRKKIIAGTPLVMKDIKYIPDEAIKTMAFSIGLLIGFIQLFFILKEFKKYGYKKRFTQFC